MTINRYFDNAATSFPKPRVVSEAMSRYLNEIGGSYGRSAYPRACEVARTVELTRSLLAALLETRHIQNIVFTLNATAALNMVIQSLLGDGGAVLVSPLEHNAVIRPLVARANKQHIAFNVLPAFPDGFINVDAVKRMLSPDVKLVIVNHQSNINGVIQPLQQIKAVIGNIPLLVDASQSLGAVPIHIDAWQIDYCAFTGHKALLGPPGIGGLFVREAQTLRPLMYGGTGSVSDQFDMPTFMPDKLEAGTPNIVGIYGLCAALQHYPDPCHTTEDFIWFIERLRVVSGMTVYAAHNKEYQGKVISMAHGTRTCSEVGDILSERYGIDVRVGLHCAPAAHQALGTFPAGTVRIAPSVYHTRADFEYVIQSFEDMVCS